MRTINWKGPTNIAACNIKRLENNENLNKTVIYRFDLNKHFLLSPKISYDKYAAKTDVVVNKSYSNFGTLFSITCLLQC